MENGLMLTLVGKDRPGIVAKICPGLKGFYFIGL